MSWAEVLKINSDTSTPLNEFIESKMRYVSSENVISVVDSNVTASTTEKTHLNNKVMKHPGVLSVKIVKPTTLSVELYVYKNNEKIVTIDAVKGTIYTAPFEFEKNDIIKMTTKKEFGSGTIDYISLLGMVAFGDF